MSGNTTQFVPDSFVCTSVMPGLGCKLPEMVVLGTLFWLGALVSSFFLVYHFRKSKNKWRITDQTVQFWTFMIVWQIYRGIISIFYFDWTPRSYIIGFTSLNHILLFIPMCIVILILFDLLFTYRNPGQNAMLFFRSLFLIFLITFVILGVTLCLVDVNNSSDPDASMSLWCACTDLVLVIFFVMPARALLSAVEYPMVQPEDAGCVQFCKVGIIIYTLLYTTRLIYNGTHFFNINPINEWYNNEAEKANPYPSKAQRTYAFFFYFLFDYVPSVFAIISVYLFKKHDMMFNENPYYTRQSD